jgi:hypothetical protein
MPLITLRKYLRSSGSLGTILARYRRSFLLRNPLTLCKGLLSPSGNERNTCNDEICMTVRVNIYHEQKFEQLLKSSQTGLVFIASGRTTVP